MGRHNKTLREPQLHFICGKGGVGKSTYACALAKHFTQKKLRTLLVQVNASDSHSAILKTTFIDSTLRQAEPLLWVVNVTPKDSLREYLLLKVPSPQLYRLIFESPLLRSFLKFVPALAELNMLGKIWYHAQEKNEEETRYQRIVIDCPATGHGLRFLSVAKVTYEGIKKGGIAEEALQIASMIADAKRSALHIITLPEEMAVNEALHLMQEVQNSKVIALYMLVINGLSKAIFSQASKEIIEQITASKLLPDFDQLINAAQKRIIQAEAELAQTARMQAVKGDKQFLQLPRLRGNDEAAVTEMMLFNLNAFA